MLEYGGMDPGVEAVRPATHGSFGRVVVDLSSTGTPGCVIEHNHSPCPRGPVFPFEYARAVARTMNLLGVAGPLEVSGSPRTGEVVTDIVHDVNRHGTSQFTIRLKKRTPFSVPMLQQPTRLAADILPEPAQPVIRPLGIPAVDVKRREPRAPDQQLVTGDGSTALEVTPSGVNPRAQDEAQQPTSAPHRGPGGGTNEVISVVSFEDHSHFILGLDGTAPYSVTLLDQPQHFVVDILHE